MRNPEMRPLPVQLYGKLGEVESKITLKDPKGTIRAHLVRMGFRPIRPGYREVAFWYETRRKIARVDSINSATLFRVIGADYADTPG